MRFDARALGVTAAGFGCFLNLYSTQAILPELARDFGVALPQTGLTVMAPLLAVALVAPFVGFLSDQRGRKVVITSALWLLVVPTALLALTSRFAQMVGLRFLQGLTLPFIFAVTVAYIGDEASDAENIRLAGIYSVGTIVGGFAGRFILGHLTAASGWRTGFLALAALTAVAGLVVMAALPKERRFHPQFGLGNAFRNLGVHLSDRRLLATYAAGFAVLFSIVAAFTFANFLLAAPPYRFGPAALGNLFAVYLLAIVTTPLASRLAILIGRRDTLLVAALIGCLGMGLTLFPSIAAIIIGLALAIGGMFIEQVLAIGYVGVAARRARSTAVGLYVTAYYTGGSLGAILPAGLWQRAGWPGCVGLVILVQAVMMGLVFAFWRQEQAI